MNCLLTAETWLVCSVTPTSAEDGRGLVVHVLGGDRREPEGHQGPPQHPQARHERADRGQGEVQGGGSGGGGNGTVGVSEASYRPGTPDQQRPCTQCDSLTCLIEGVVVLTLEYRHGGAWTMQACAACHKDAVVGVIECKACESKTHLKCVSPPMSAVRFQWF